MMPIERVASELEGLVMEDSIFEDLVEQGLRSLIFEILEICLVECLVVDLVEQDQGERQKEMILKSISKLPLKRPILE